MSTPVAVLVTAALWLGCLWAAPPVTAAVALVLLALGLISAACRHPVTATATVLIGVVLLGAALTGSRDRLRAASPLTGLAARGAERHLVGRVVTEPRSTAFGQWTIVRVTRVDDTALASRAVLQAEAGERLEIGATVEGRMRIAALDDDGFGAYLRTLGVAASLVPSSPPRIGGAPAVIRHTTVVRRRARAVFDQALSPGRAAILAGLVLGMRDGIPVDELRAAGLSHLVVVSGRHVALLLVGLLTIASLFGMGHRGRHRAALIGLWWFVVLTRWQPSVLRAAVMATLALVAVLRGRTRDTVHTLAVTVLVLLLIDPMLARQAGFALSVLAAGGVMIVVRRHPDRPRGRIETAVRATLGAQIATAPVLLTIAGTIPLAAVPANLVAGPAAMVAQGVGLVAAAMAVLRLPGAVAAAHLAGGALAVLEWAAAAFVALPALSAGAAAAVATCATALWLARHRLPEPLRSGSTIAWIATAALVAVVVAGLRPPGTPSALRLVTLDVGQGDALLVEAPDAAGGARMIVDGGPEPDLVATLLRRRRIRSLDAVVLTHGDDDHTGGLAAVLRGVRVGRLLVPAGDTTLRGGAPSARAAVVAARARHVPVVGIHAGQRFRLGSARVEVLAPTANVVPGAGRNSRSIVLRVTGRHGRMLLTADADPSTQLRMLARPERLRADVLKVPHHGGDTNADGFLDAVHAVVAVASVGAGNSYGHPDPHVTADIAPVPLWRTDRNGTVTITLTARGPTVEAEVYTAADD